MEDDDDDMDPSEVAQASFSSSSSFLCKTSPFSSPRSMDEKKESTGEGVKEVEKLRKKVEELMEKLKLSENREARVSRKKNGQMDSLKKKVAILEGQVQNLTLGMRPRLDPSKRKGDRKLETLLPEYVSWEPKATTEEELTSVLGEQRIITFFNISHSTFRFTKEEPWELCHDFPLYRGELVSTGGKILVGEPCKMSSSIFKAASARSLVKGCCFSHPHALRMYSYSARGEGADRTMQLLFERPMTLWGSVRTLLSKKITFEPKTLLIIARQVHSVVSAMHSRSLTHGWIASRTVFLSGEENASPSTSAFIETKVAFCGMDVFNRLRMNRDHEASFRDRVQFDVLCYGIFLLELLTGEDHFKQTADFVRFSQSQSKIVDAAVKEVNPTLWNDGGPLSIIAHAAQQCLTGPMHLKINLESVDFHRDENIQEV